LSSSQGKKKPKKEGAVKAAKDEVKKVERVSKKEAKKVEGATKREAKKLEKAVERKVERRAPPQRPSGHVPTPMVLSRHGEGMVSRQGRGFSLGELSGAGVAPRLASRWGVRVDSRRRSVIEGNVGLLRGWTSRAGTASKVESGAKKAGEEIREVERKVEKEAVAVEAEVVKLEEAAGKEAKKVAKEVRSKAERKPRAKKKED
jgi:ribosomal protein L13E